MKPTVRPRELRIAGKLFNVLWVKPAALESKNYGHTDIEKLEIAIRDNLPAAVERDTLLHEMLHGIDEQLDLELSEHQVEVLGCMLQQVFADNPALLTYLQRR